MRPTVRSTTRVIAFSLLLGAAVSCGGDTTSPDVPGSITINPSTPPPIAAGSQLQLSATVISSKGKPMSGEGLTFTTSSPAILSVSATGQVTSLGPAGTATVTASVGSVHNSVTVTVVAGAAATLTRTSADPGAVAPGATVGDSVRYVVKDAFGNPRAQEIVNFTIAAGEGMASPASARTDVLGRVATVFTTGLTAGPNTLNAVVAGVAPVGLSLVTAIGSVTITSISPSPMTPGASVTIQGSGFDPVATGDVVTIDGQAVTVTSASAGQLVITIPPGFACTPTHQATVQVTASGASAVARQTLRVGVQRAMSLGSSLVLMDGADIACTELSPANGRYIVNVVSRSTVPTGLTPFQLVGATSIPPGATFAPNVFSLRQSVRVPLARARSLATEPAPFIRSATHLAELESNRLRATRLKSTFRRSGTKALSTGAPVRAALTTAVPVVGQTRTFRVHQPSTAVGGSANCTDFVEITAKAVYVGTRAVVYEDVHAPLVGQMDSYFTRLGQEFDATMYPSDSAYFGDPLVTDQFTDNDQHLNMVFTPSIPSTLGGFVLSCDFFPRNTTSNQVSNFGETFYARVPTVAGSGFGSDTPDRWLRGIRATVVHEVKHVASLGARIVNGIRFEESWLEEATAMISEEVWARERIYQGATWKGNMLYASTLYCDVRPTFPECDARPLAVFDHFASLYRVLEQPDATSLFGRVADNDFTFYYAGWSFVRYSIDRYAASERDFLRALTQEPDLVGLDNLEARTGGERTAMTSNWSLALYLDENAATVGNIDVAFPSWHFRDIYLGINRDFGTTSYPKPFPLIPQRVTAGDFTIDNAGIHGGSFAPYELPPVTAGGNARTIGVKGAPPISLAVARIE